MVEAADLYEEALAHSRAARFEEVDRVVAKMKTRFAESSDPEARRSLCRVLFGVTQDRPRRHGRRDLAHDLDAFDEIYTIASREPIIEDVAAEALFAMGKRSAFELPGSPIRTRGHAAYRELARRFAPSRDPRTAHWVANGLTNLASSEHPETDAARALYEQVIMAYADAEPLDLRRLAAQAMQAWGLRLLRRQRDVDALAVWDWSVRLFGTSTEPALEAILAADMVNRALAEGRLHGPAAELAVYEQLDRRYGPSTDIATLRSVAIAANNRALTLVAQHRLADAKSLLAATLRPFAATTAASLATDVERARLNLADLEAGRPLPR